MENLPGIKTLAERYDGLILDLWGVVHDGHEAYEGVIGGLRGLKAAGVDTILLSNAPRRAQPLIDLMTSMGIDRDLYGHVLSSGEATRDALLAKSDPFFAALGPKTYHLGPDRDKNVLEGTGFVEVGEVEAADWVFNTGPTDLSHGLDLYRPLLKQAAGLDLPMVCANPDLVVMRQGQRVICAGAFAQIYKEHGGVVAYRGKPDPAIYTEAMAKLGTSPGRTAVVGDALETDVKGATASGLDAVWCTGGIHAEALGVAYGMRADTTGAQALADEHGFAPVAIIPGFIWA